VIYQGDVFAVSHSGVFAATDVRTGQARWSLPIVGVTSPWPAGDVVYVVSKTGELICAQRETGQIYWIRDLNAGFKTKPRRGFGNVFGLMGGSVVRPVWSGPLLANERLILVSTSGELVSVNAKTGEVARRMDIGAPAKLAPIAVGDTIYVATDSAQLIALR
jgi:outer membrane protein assembly factor BamB